MRATHAELCLEIFLRGKQPAGLAMLLTMSAILAGCPGFGTPPAPVSQPETTATELGFDLQLARVQSGESDTIAVQYSELTLDQWTQLAAVAGQLRILTVEQGRPPVEALQALAGNASPLERLRLGGPVDDEHLQQIARLGSLKVLNLPAGEFSDAGLGLLSALPRLELLRFHSGRVSDRGIAMLRLMPALRFLHLIETPVSDAALADIADMPQLESFYLDGGLCTEAGLSELVKRRRDLHFHWNEMHLPGDQRDHTH